MNPRLQRAFAALVPTILLLAAQSSAAEYDRELLDILLENGSITQEQYDSLAGKDDLTADDLGQAAQPESLPPVEASGGAATGDSEKDSDASDASDDSNDSNEFDERLNERIANAIAERIDEAFPVRASYGSKGFRLETIDGNWQTNLQWRFQFRLTNPYLGDPRQVDDFEARDKTDFQARRLRMKIGGHGYRPLAQVLLRGRSPAQPRLG